MSEVAAGRTITRDQFLALTGLLAIARRHNQALADILRAAGAITGEENLSLGHTADAVYELGPAEVGAEELLSRLGLGVSPPEQLGTADWRCSYCGCKCGSPETSYTGDHPGACGCGQSAFAGDDVRVRRLEEIAAGAA